MKNKFLLLAMCFALTTQMIVAQVPSFVPTNGLVGYWPFNGNANDVSGNGNNGVVNGAYLSSDRFGNNASSYIFNRTNVQSIDVSNSELLNNISDVTFSFWFNIDSYGVIGESGHNFFINKSDQNNQHQFVLASNFTGLYFYYGGDSNFLQTQTLPSLNQWNHLVVTYKYDGSIQNSWCKFYLNGVLTNFFVTSMNLSHTNYDLRFGSFSTSAVNTVDGNMDDIGIWNRALTQDEITSLYYAENTCQSLVINTGVLSFNPPTYNNTVAIYPNPANDQITIDCGNLTNVSGWTIKIVNTLGQEVFSGAMNTQQYVVPLNSWSGQGIYFVKIYDGSNNLMNTKKIILQ